jgi:protein involved in polysaccharide export with SLBB domain
MKSLIIAAMLVATLAATGAAQHGKARGVRRPNEIGAKHSATVPRVTRTRGPLSQKPGSSSGAGVSAAHAAGIGNTGSGGASSQIYRVGIRDVLDIQLTDNPNSNSTLFTVLDGGMLDYPFAGNPFAVAGLTTSEIATLLRQRIKIFEKPTVVVSVRDFASHAVSVTGFVAAPGTKTLHREAMPLYTILAESLVLPEAARATIIRKGRAPLVIDLKNANAASTLVVAGDTIKVSGANPGPTAFFFVGGEVKAPGQKLYNQGLTLTQAILASGGTNASAGAIVRVSRQRVDGRLTTAEYNLKQIQTGILPDPPVLKGDRIEVAKLN